MLFHPGWHYSWPLSERIPMRPFLTLGTSAGARWGICHFLPADHYSHADAPKPIPFDSPGRADSNETLPDSAGHLPAEISAFFIQLTAIAMRTLRNLYHSIPLDRRIPTNPVPMLSDHWLKSYPPICTWVPQASIFKLFATECYRDADASSPIPFDSPRRADPNETLPDTAGHLPAEISAFFILPTAIAMWTLRNLHNSIFLDRRIPSHTVPMLSDRWLKGYPPICTWVSRASIFKLFATECYRHADASTRRPIPFNSPRRADSNETLPDSAGHLLSEISAFFILLTAIAMRTLRNLYHSIPLSERTPMRPFPILPDICPPRYLPFSPCWPL